MAQILVRYRVGHRASIRSEHGNASNGRIDGCIAIERHDCPAVLKIFLKAHVGLRNLRVRPETHGPFRHSRKRLSRHAEPCVEVDVIHRRIPWHLSAEEHVLAIASPRQKLDRKLRRAIVWTVFVPEVSPSVQPVKTGGVMMRFTIATIDIAGLEHDHVQAALPLLGDDSAARIRNWHLRLVDSEDNGYIGGLIVPVRGEFLFRSAAVIERK